MVDHQRLDLAGRRALRFLHDRRRLLVGEETRVGNAERHGARGLRTRHRRQALDDRPRGEELPRLRPLRRLFAELTVDENLRTELKREGFLTRDAREKERAGLVGGVPLLCLPSFWRFDQCLTRRSSSPSAPLPSPPP